MGVVADGTDQRALGRRAPACSESLEEQTGEAPGVGGFRPVGNTG